jgi:hypothetical protein
MHWENGDAVPCHAESCPILASFLDPNTVRLVRGAAGVMAQTTQRSSRCERLARAHPKALEVWFRRASSLFNDVESDLPLETIGWISAGASGLLVERDELMPDAASAQRSVERDACLELWGSGSTALDAVCERSHQDLLVHTRASVRWEDLRLRAEDALRHARAQRYAQALERARPDSAVDMANLEDVWKELSVRRALLDDSSAEPAATALELLRFVERAAAQHPGEPRLIALQAELARIAQVTPASGPAMTAP